MAKGFEFELSNGTILKVVPNAGVDNCVISHGESEIEIDVQNTSFRIAALAGKGIAAIPAVVRFEIKELTVTNCVESEVVNEGQYNTRACLTCDGETCCATNCCCDCGCGWVCG